MRLARYCWVEILSQRLVNQLENRSVIHSCPMYDLKPYVVIFTARKLMLLGPVRQMELILGLSLFGRNLK